MLNAHATIANQGQKGGDYDMGKKVPRTKEERQAVAGKSGIGLTLAEMSETQFKGHIGRVLDRMRSHKASKEILKDAETRILAKREKALTAAVTAMLMAMIMV